MHEQMINAIIDELRPALEGSVMGKVFQLSRAAIAIDFRTDGGRYLLLAAESSQPRLYFIKRTVRELEKASLAPTPFALALRRHLSGARLVALTKDPGERVVRFLFTAPDVVGRQISWSLVAQLSGRSANLFLLDGASHIVDTLLAAHGAGQEIGDTYQPPPPAATPAPVVREVPFTRGEFATLSEGADAYYRRLAAERAFTKRAAALSAKLRQEMGKRRKLLRNLESDLADHGDAEQHRRVGDLLLANIANAERRGSIVRLVDYYAEDAPTIEIEVDEQKSLPEEAAARFAKYTKAKRAAQEIARRAATAREEFAALEERQAVLETIIDARDEGTLDDFAGVGRTPGQARRADDGRSAASASKRAEAAAVPGARRYRSSDGYEILVGRAARDNDHLTFRVARSNDLWLHAADYPGSHVIVRNHQRERDLPHRTVIEAAQLAAHFSQARLDSKVAVHYTPRKFLSKPKGAAPGLVRMSSFRTLLVEPRESVERIPS
ncbi:MAG: NFACT family protein [Pyrinomonadaceae bacterium]|nr:NFACT family protein [Pyrinomonadaceae bacterium]